MHIYAFGSVCRGDVSPGSDIDLLAIVQGHDARFNPDDYSIYSYERIQDIWKEGNPFAWHLAIESKLLYSSDQSDLLALLGRPCPYVNCIRDCEKFQSLFREARASYESQGGSQVFDLSMVFLAIRNFATCFSLGVLDKADFSRSSALRLGRLSLSIPQDAYAVLERSRTAREGLDSATGRSAEVAAWRAGDQPAWFFIDSVDEAKLDGIRLETALRRISEGIEGARSRAHIIMSGRYSDWEFRTDLERFEQYLPVPAADPHRARRCRSPPSSSANLRREQIGTPALKTSVRESDAADDYRQ